MAFWGVEVKPGKPVTHSCEKARGRLRTSQATMGIGEVIKKTFVQCNVGNRSPVESYGVDIQNSQTEGSSYGSEGDKYEGSFIDDDEELQVAPPSPVSSSKEDDEPKGRKGRGRKLKKKSQVIESDNDTDSLKSDDEDGFLLSVFKSKRDAKRTELQEENDQVAAEICDKAKDITVHDSKSNEMVGQEDGSESEVKLPLDDRVTRVNNENDELPKKHETFEELTANGEHVLTSDKVHEDMEEAKIIDQELPINNEKDQIQSLDLTKPKRKRKERAKADEKTNEVEINKDHSVVREDKEHETEASKNMESGVSSLVSPPEPGSKKGQKSKKRRKELLTGTVTEGIVPEGQNNAEDDKFKQGLSHTDIIMDDLPAANGEYKEQQIDNNVTTELELVVNGNQLEKKYRKKAKKKSQNKGDLNMGVPNTTDNQETAFTKQEDQPTNAVANDKRTLSNGLTIEVLVHGQPGGKVAAQGKKVKIYFTAMLKETGHIFDSNAGKASCEFRLGDDKFIEGWNVGIEGMCIGEKRRLIIPPSMGYGNHEAAENVPPNSWLVYDVVLVGVHR